LLRLTNGVFTDYDDIEDLTSNVVLANIDIREGRVADREIRPSTARNSTVISPKRRAAAAAAKSVFRRSAALAIRDAAFRPELERGKDHSVRCGAKTGAHGDGGWEEAED
jgi:hypothetical protein